MSDEISKAEAEVNAALTNLRKALRGYRQAAGRPPLFLHEKVAPKLRPEGLTEARVFASRHDMMTALVSSGMGGEVGVQRGDFSRFLLDSIGPEKLHLFDLSDRWLRADVRDDPRCELHLGDSANQLARQPNHSFDWLYIDGDHSYKGVHRDALVALQKIKPGGTLIFNDYTIWSPGEAIPYGVIPCVNELVDDGLDMIGVALTHNGYFDVALRAPS
ncbi:MAG: class I SAM-dependent methyltransferase [Paracoccaceae bacterium]